MTKGLLMSRLNSVLLALCLLCAAVQTGGPGIANLSTLPVLTTAGRDAASPIDGSVIYNSDTREIEVYDASASVWQTSGAAYGEMYITGNGTESTIDAVDQYHAAIGLAGSDPAPAMRLWSRAAGSTVAITSFADYSGTVAGTIKATTASAHGFTTGDPIAITGADIEATDPDPYAGVYLITVVDADEFYFTNGSWNATQTGTATLPDRLVAGAGAAGTYQFHGSGSFQAADASKRYDFYGFKNASVLANQTVQIEAKQVGVISALVGNGTVTVAEGDQWWFAVQGVTDASNFTLINASVILRRIGP